LGALVRPNEEEYHIIYDITRLLIADGINDADTMMLYSINVREIDEGKDYLILILYIMQKKQEPNAWQL
jgi:hypothetical protein